MRTTCCGEITENWKGRLQTLLVCSRLFPKGGTYTPMIRKIDHNRMGRSERGWLTCWFHFPFAEYAGPDTPPFGCLQVLNDELIQPGFGFDTHFHRDMEILTYVADGELTHADSLKNHRVLGRGELQYISAGTGLFHSERNEGRSLLRLLQIGIPPDKPGYPPPYDARLLSLGGAGKSLAPPCLRHTGESAHNDPSGRLPICGGHYRREIPGISCFSRPPGLSGGDRGGGGAGGRFPLRQGCGGNRAGFGSDYCQIRLPLAAFRYVRRLSAANFAKCAPVPQHKGAF